jgi:hypothetical protein
VYYLENCRVSDKGIEQLFKMQQLTELHLGGAVEKADGDRNIFTVNGFIAVLKALPKLTVLDMQLPYIKNLNMNGMGTYSLFNLGIGDRGV